MNEINCEKLIKMLSQFPEDKPIRILALGMENDLTEETIGEVGYPIVHYDEEYDEKGNPILVAEDKWVGIFTKEYNDNILMNGI